LAATIWIGGQFTLAGVVPTLRQGGPAVVSGCGPALTLMAWPAYVVLLEREYGTSSRSSRPSSL